MKSRTTVYLTKELKELAKKNKLNLSLLLEDAITFKLSLSDKRKELLEQKNKLLSELNLIESKLLSTEENRKKEKALEQKKEFIEDLHKTRKNYFSEEAKNNSYLLKTVVDSFQKKYGLERDKVMTLILDKRIKFGEAMLDN